MTTVEARIERLSAQDRRELSIRAARILAPYGEVGATVIHPVAFTALHERLTLCATRGLCPEAPDIVFDCEEVLAPFAEDEPTGPAFFTHAAVVGLLYLAQTLAGDPAGPVNAAKRLVDALGFADDEGQGGLYQAAIVFLDQPTEDRALELRKWVAAHAHSLTLT